MPARSRSRGRRRRRGRGGACTQPQSVTSRPTSPSRSVPAEVGAPPRRRALRPRRLTRHSRGARAVLRASSPRARRGRAPDGGPRGARGRGPSPGRRASSSSPTMTASRAPRGDRRPAEAPSGSGPPARGPTARPSSRSRVASAERRRRRPARRAAGRPRPGPAPGAPRLGAIIASRSSPSAKPTPATAGPAERRHEPVVPSAPADRVLRAEPSGRRPRTPSACSSRARAPGAGSASYAYALLVEQRTHPVEVRAARVAEAVRHRAARRS